jgi:hypothetical protein
MGRQRARRESFDSIRFDSRFVNARLSRSRAGVDRFREFDGLNRLVRIGKPVRQVQGGDDTRCSVTEREEWIRFNYSNEDNKYEEARKNATTIPQAWRD